MRFFNLFFAQAITIPGRFGWCTKNKFNRNDSGVIWSVYMKASTPSGRNCVCRCWQLMSGRVCKPINADENCLADLFHNITTQKKKVGTIAPKKFIARLKKEKGISFLKFFLCLETDYLLNYRGIWQLHAARCSWISQFPYQPYQWSYIR